MAGMGRTGSALAVLGGGTLLAAQSRANGTLASAMGDPFATAIWSIGSGWVLLCLAFLDPRARAVLPRLRRAHRGGELAWWMFLGGLVGGILVTTQAYAVPIAGVALVLICIVAGQTLSALWVDHAGFGPGGPKPVSRGRVVAASATLIGVAVAVGPRIGVGGARVVLPALLALGVGALLAVQTATNGRVNVVGGNPFVTTWINFSWGLLVVVVAGGVHALATGSGVPTRFDAPWWAWTGGVLGVIYVAINAVAVRRIGVLYVMLLAITGQLAGALVLDLLDPVQRAHVGAGTVAGVAITLAACLAAGLSSRLRAQSGAASAGAR